MNAPESLSSLAQHLRRMADEEPMDQIDADRLTRAADLIESPHADLPPQCCMCAKTGLSTAEDGGPEYKLDDGRWVCSRECYDHADAHAALAEMLAKAREDAWREAAEIADAAMKKYAAAVYDKSTVKTFTKDTPSREQNAAKCYCAGEIHGAILALIDQTANGRADT